MSIVILRDFFLWCSIINIALFIISVALFISPLRYRVFKLHIKWFNINEAGFNFTIYMIHGVGNLLILIFNIIPFIALCIVE